MNTGSSPNTQFICDDASDVIDEISSGGDLVGNFRLSEAKGWVSTCVAGDGHTIIMAGGGKKGTEPHSKTADLLDTSSGKVSSNPFALHEGAWGVPCATIGNETFFLGGKVTISGYDKAYTTAAINVYSPAGWTVAPYQLSRGRESAAAFVLRQQLLSAGGWMKNDTVCPQQYCGDDSLDIFRSPFSSGGGRRTARLHAAFYDAGVAVVDDIGYVVGDTNLYIFSIDGSLPVNVQTEPLPKAMRGPASGNTGGGAVPRAHIPQNGAVVGQLACFCGATPCALYCYDTSTNKVPYTYNILSDSGRQV